MRTFKDSQQREWRISINVDAVELVRGRVQVDLLDIAGGKLLEQLLGDPMQLVRIVEVLVEPQLGNVTPAEFRAAMTGEAIDGAIDALLEELIGFFPRSRRALLTAALAKARELDQALVSRAMAQIAAATPESVIASAS